MSVIKEERRYKIILVREGQKTLILKQSNSLEEMRKMADKFSSYKGYITTVVDNQKKEIVYTGLKWK